MTRILGRNRFPPARYTVFRQGTKSLRKTGKVDLGNYERNLPWKHPAFLWLFAFGSGQELSGGVAKKQERALTFENSRVSSTPSFINPRRTGSSYHDNP